MSSGFRELADAKFVSLTTFKRDGDGVAAPVWIVGDGDHLMVWTPADSWKVKRLRRDPRVTLVPCSRRGKVAGGDAAVSAIDGRADVVDDAAVVSGVEAALKKKYGVEYWVVTLIERIAARGSKPRVVITISPV